MANETKTTPKATKKVKYEAVAIPEEITREDAFYVAMLQRLDIIIKLLLEK